MTEPTPTAPPATSHAIDADTDRLAALRPRGVRRAVVLASAVLMATAAAMIWFDAAGAGWHVAYLASAALALTGLALLRLAVRAHLRGSDERLASARDAAYRTSYWILAPAIAIALLAVELSWAQSWGAFTAEPAHLRALMLAFVAAAVWLPAAILAWREPHL